MQTSAKACPAAREIPGRSDAEQALAAALNNARQTSIEALLLLPDHLASLTEAGEYETADRALVACCQEFVRALPPGSRVYRWSATALLAVVGAPDAAVLKRTTTIGKTEIFSLDEYQSLEGLRRALDLFIAENLG